MTSKSIATSVETRAVLPAMLRGAVQRCPNCGKGHLYRAYLKVADECPSCGEELHHQRADDAPPYVTIFVVGHLVIGSLLAVDIAYDWPVWLHMAVWLPLTVMLCLALLPMVKGALIGLQWALRMHGFRAVSDQMESLHDSIPMKRLAFEEWSSSATAEHALAGRRRPRLRRGR